MITIYLLGLTDGSTINITWWQILGAPLVILIALFAILSLIYGFVKKPRRWSKVTWLFVFGFFSLLFSAAFFTLLYPVLINLPF